MAEEAQRERDRNADGDGLALFAEDPGKTNHRIRNHVVQKDDARAHQERVRVRDVIQSQKHLRDAVRKRNQHAPFPSVTMADHNDRKHTQDRDAAAEGQVDLDHAANRRDRDHQRAFHKLHGRDLLFVFFKFHTFSSKNRFAAPPGGNRKKHMDALPTMA